MYLGTCSLLAGRSSLTGLERLSSASRSGLLVVDVAARQVVLNEIHHGPRVH